MKKFSLVKLFAVLGLFLFLSAHKVLANPLEDYIQEVLSKNTSVLDQQARVEAAKLQKRQLYSGLYPKLGANWSLNKSSNVDAQDSIALGAQQSLFAGGAEYSELAAQESQIKKEEATLEDLKDQVRAQALTYILNWTLAQEKQKILNESLKAQEARLKELQRRVRLGQSREPDLIQSELEFSRAERRLLDIQAELLSEERNILSLSANQAPPKLSLENVLVWAKVFPRDEFKISALNHSVERLSYKEKSLYRSYLPKLSAFANTYPNKATPLSNEWDMGLRAEVTLFEGFKTPSLIQENRTQKSFAENALFQAQLNRSESLKLLQSEERLLERKKVAFEGAVSRAKKSVDIQQRDYRLGIVTELEVQQSLQSYLELRLEEVEVLASQLRLKIKRSLGGENSL